jgi:hypothetical protein
MPGLAKGPFWAWNDIGSGLKWHLCVMTGSAKKPMIKYLTEDFEDYWYDDDWDESEIVPVNAPEPLET